MSKKFTKSPAAAFFSSVGAEPESLPKAPTPAVPETPIPDKPEARAERINVRKDPDEIRSRRVQLLMQKSLYKKAKAHCKKRGISFNEYIHQVIEEDLLKY